MTRQLLMPFIQPIEDAIGPATPLRALITRHSIDDLVRCINEGLEIFDAGRVLMAHEGELNILKDILKAKEPV